MTVSFTNLHALGFAPSHKILLDADGAPRFAVLANASKAIAPSGKGSASFSFRSARFLNR